MYVLRFRILNNERDALRAQNEEEFKAKRAAEEKKRQDALREKDEPGLRAKMAAKEKKRQDAAKDT